MNNAPSFGYGGLAVDPAHPGWAIVATIDHWNGGDDIYRTTDGGKHWKGLKSSAVLDATLSPYLAGEDGKVGFGHWMGALMIDPFDPNHAFYGTGATVWATSDLESADKGKPTHWVVGANGIEETAVLTLVSPPTGPHLFSGLGDIGCFRNDDFDHSPAQGALGHPRMSNCSSIDYAASNPALMVRAGGSWGGAVHGAVSTDQGITWKPFRSEPANAQYGGRIALSADGKVLLWAPGRGVLAISHDLGDSWKMSDKAPQRAQIVADRVTAEAFYVYDLQAAKLYALTDAGAGASFKPLAVAVPKDCRMFITPDHPADLWFAGDHGLWHVAHAAADTEAVKLGDVSSAYAVGFGKALGSASMTLFLSGTVAGQEGIFRSTDEGRNWVRISDPEHRYGFVGVVSGDPRIFGRVYLGTNGRGVLMGDPAAEAQGRSQ
jgi:photosystem II stability/assembly factor-like uncharacterized protein